MDFESFVLAAVTSDLVDGPEPGEDADAVEFRMDLAADPMSQLTAYDADLPVIATNRVESEGGAAADDANRLDSLAAAAEHAVVAAIDIELGAIEDGEGAAVLERARAHDAAIIVSAHDFNGTPSRDELDGLLDRAGVHGDVAKLAVTAADPGDVLDLLAVTWQHTVAGNHVATMAMGEIGRHSRAIAPFYGSRIGYAPLDPTEATAPGQYDLTTLRALIDALKGSTPSRAEE